MKITKIYYNFIVAALDGDMGEEYDIAEVGKMLYTNGEKTKVIRITEYRPKGIGDKWFYDIILENGAIIRTFNPNTVFYKK